MPIVLGADLGTTKITALALDTQTGNVLASAAEPNHAEITTTSDRARGYSEWDAPRIAEIALDCLKEVAGRLGERHGELAGLGITGQQHGVTLVNAHLRPLTPLVNWQDRRGDEPGAGPSQTFVQRAVALAGPEMPRRTGCRLAAGYMGVTLFWMKETGTLPPAGTACFLMDYFAALLTGRSPVTDPTCAASSGLLDITAGDWEPALLAALGLPRRMFPEVRTSGERLGELMPEPAARSGLPAGLPVFVGIGDNQASFLGSVGDPTDAALVNVGTGGQVAAYTTQFAFDPLLETRPFPRGGYLLVSAGLAGGAAYAALERFFRECGAQLFGVAGTEPLFPRLNQLAAAAPAGACGLRCEPFFTGTRARPELRASWTNVSAENFTPANCTRALLEGMARTFREGFALMNQHVAQPCARLIGAGNGLRENRVLARIVAEAFEMRLLFSQHREEAAYGAALLAAVGAEVFPDVATAGRIIRYQASEPG